MKEHKFNSESGVSVLEVLIVVLIGAVLVGFAIAQFGTSREQMKRQNIARELKNNLERCRFDSVRRRASDADYANMSRVVLRSTTSYDIMTDSNLDGIIESGEVRTVDFSASNTKILAPSSLFPITIRFDRKGHITTDGNGTAMNPLFTICSGVCSMATTITPENGNVISISPTGTVAMLYGGDTIPPLDAPSISNMTNSNNINLWLTIGATPIPTTPTPAATVSPSATVTATVTPVASPSAEIVIIGPTPSPTASSTPVSTPTIEPTPVPTATPTPTPSNECALNQKPSVTGCVCSSPRTVKTNGKCQY